MNQPAKVWPLLRHSPDPRVRSYLIHRLRPLGAGAGDIVKQLDMESDVTILRALVLTLEDYGDTEFTPDARNALLPKLQEMYTAASDPGLHAACEWLLRRWKQEAWLTRVNEAWAKDEERREKRLEGIGKALSTDKEKAQPQWYVNTQGQTMVVIPGPVEFVMGSPPTEAGREPAETQHKMRIGRTFVLAAKPVTVAEYRKFEPRYGVGHIERWARSADSPVIATNRFQAVQYCNWISKQEGLPESEWCYEPLHGKYEEGMRLARNYLQRQGYRLPTEAEMEYATRAGAVTARYYGETDELLPKYAWYNKNAQEKTWPVGSMKPNDLGLFDAQGNVWTWCQEKYKAYPQGNKATDDTEDDLLVNGTVDRVLRGASYDYQPSQVRSANRNPSAAIHPYGDYGFRLARTYR
jgi:formylglycine-generating enzyme required for sulfatase activity